MLPKPLVPRRECTHSPRYLSPHIAIDLESVKQVLCQPYRSSDESSESVCASGTCVSGAHTFRNRDMSSQCRRVGTGIVADQSKPLNCKENATVAERRQVRAVVSLCDTGLPNAQAGAGPPSRTRFVTALTAHGVACVVPCPEFRSENYAVATSTIQRSDSGQNGQDVCVAAHGGGHRSLQ